MNMLVFQTIFAETAQVHDRIADLSALSDELCIRLDANDQMTLKLSVEHVKDRVMNAVKCAEETESSFVRSINEWNALQVCYFYS